MRKKMEKLGEQVNDNLGGGGVVKFTENPVNLQDYGKYFLEFHNTHKIVRKWDTQAEAIDGLEDIIENGLTDGSHRWTVK